MINGKSQILFINGTSSDIQTNYEIIREKREQSPWFYPDIDKNRISCQLDIYEKLIFCSQLTECQGLATCFDSLHCPINVRSYGSLIYNLLRILGVNNCQINDQSCSNDKRVVLLQKLLNEWDKYKISEYCSTISMFLEETKKNVQEICPMNLKQVSQFLENYSCLIVTDSAPSIDSATSKPSQIVPNSSSQIGYIDEDNELEFINTNSQPINTTEHTVYINDHRYYNVSYIHPVSSNISKYFIEDGTQFIPIHPLYNRHRSAYGIHLNFNFPFYGHQINKILIATGGFIYTGELLHSALIGSTQYIAPFMANFDASVSPNETEIKYFDNGTHFVCLWKKIYLQDQQNAGGFTFQVILQNTGRIYFNYVDIPQMRISSLHHAHRLGVSDAYLSEHKANEHFVRVITLYDKINLDKNQIQNGVSVILEMDQTCNTFTDCSTCLANRGKRYNCSWCEDIGKCSDGFDRSRSQWIRSQCHQSSSIDQCANSVESPFEQMTIFSSTQIPQKKSQSSSTIVQTFRTIILTLVISVLMLLLFTIIGTYIYAYRNPTSTPGMWLMEHRPSTYIARFKRSTGSS